MSGPLDEMVGRLARERADRQERLVREDVTLLGMDPGLVIQAGKPVPRIAVLNQQTDAGDEVYRGLILDGHFVIDHCWNLPYEDRSIPRRLIGFVFAGFAAERTNWAREHSLDTRVVLPADPERLRGRNVRLVYIYGETAWRGSDRQRHEWVEAKRIVQHLNARNGWPEVYPDGH